LNNAATERRTGIAWSFVVALCASYAGLVTHPRHSCEYTALVAGGAVYIAAYVYVARTLSWRPPTVRSRVTWMAIASALPWLAALALVGARGLWWTQRDAVLRLFVLCAAASLVVPLSRFAATASSADRDRSMRRAVGVAAIAAGAIAVDGAALGLTPWGCAISLAIGAAAAATGVVALAGTRAAMLKALALTVAIVLAVAGLEAVVRALGIGHNVAEADNRQFARKFYTLTPPGSSFVNRPGPLDEFSPALVSINSFGTRGSEFGSSNADVLIIGDSMVEGRQLPWEDTVGPQLQRLLQSGGSSLRVVAQGMRGWSPLLEWNWYLKKGRLLQPRVVMLFFFWNDLWTSGTEAATFHARLGADRRPQGFDIPVDSAWVWYKHVRVLRLAADAWQRLSAQQLRAAFSSMSARTSSGTHRSDAEAETLARRMTDAPLQPSEIDTMLTTPEETLDPKLRQIARSSFWPGLRPMSLWTDAQRAAARAAEQELADFADDVAHAGGQLVIVVAPNPVQVGARECTVGRLFDHVPDGVVLPPDSGLQAWLRGVAERRHIALVDPTPTLREKEEQLPPDTANGLYLRADCHWTVRGHAAMAGALAEWIAAAVH
jgi:lysophospholipase L1-like esterase